MCHTWQSPLDEGTGPSRESMPLPFTHCMLNKIEQTARAIEAEGRPLLRMYDGNPLNHGFAFPADILQREYQRYFAQPSYAPDARGLPAAREAIARYDEGRRIADP